jgi:hypothetical protein
MPRTDSAQPANDEPEAAEPARTRTHRARSSAEARPASNDWRVGPIEPAVSAAPEPAPPASNDWRVGPIEPAVSAASNAALGTLRINSRPWSEVYLDGRLIGNTPQMGLRVPAGRYTVRLSNPELGMSKTIVVQVAAGEHVTRIESLE